MNGSRLMPGSLLAKPIALLPYFLLIFSTLYIFTTPYYYFGVVPGLLLLFFLFLSHIPYFGYHLIVFLIPFTAFRALSQEYPWLTVSKVVGAWLVLLIVLYVITNKLDLRKFKSNLWVWLLLLTLLSAISLAYTSYRKTVLSELQLLLNSVAFFGISLPLLSERGFRRTLPAVVMVSTAVASLTAALGSIFRIEMFSLGQSGVYRGIGTDLDPNVLSMMIIFSLPLAAHLFFSAKSLPGKAVAFLLAGLYLTAVVSTYSRGAFFVLLALAALTAPFILKKVKPRHLGFVAILALVGGVSLYFLVPRSWVQRQSSVVKYTDDSIPMRQAALDVGMESFRNHPLTGTGYGSFREVFANSIYAYQFYDQTKQLEIMAHNSYIEVLVGTGLPGLLLFLVVIGLTYRNFIKAYFGFKGRGDAQAADLTIFYGLSFSSVVIYFFLLSYVYHKYFWLCLALSQIALNLSAEKDTAAQKGP